MRSCPSCGSPDVYYSRIRSKFESLRKSLTKQTAYRCHRCTWRGFGEDTGPKFSPEEIAAATRAVCGESPDDWSLALDDVGSAGCEPPLDGLSTDRANP